MELRGKFTRWDRMRVRDGEQAASLCQPPGKWGRRSSKATSQHDSMYFSLELLVSSCLCWAREGTELKLAMGGAWAGSQRIEEARCMADGRAEHGCMVEKVHVATGSSWASGAGRLRCEGKKEL